MSSEIELLLTVVDQAFDKRSWHGTNLRGAVSRMTAEEAAWRPAKGRHNAWEIALHAAYWKYAVRRRLRGEARGSFPLEGSNWFVRPEGTPTEAAWKADVRLLVETHRTLRAAIAELTPADLGYTPPNSKVTTLSLVTGVAAHDLYHAGQIQTIKRLRKG
jgi:hypothetical protein